MRDFFFGVPRSSVMTTQGRVDLPMFFYDISARIINFFVDWHRALPLLEKTGLEPVRFYGGRALVSLAFMQYREVSIGGYEEVFVTIMVTPLAFPRPRVPLANLLKRRGIKWTMGGYVLEMPVTLHRARAAGREIWGYPKFETDIPFNLAGRHFEYSVLDPSSGEPLLEVSADESPGIKMPAFDMVSFGNHDGKILRTITEVDGWYRCCMVRNLRIEVGNPDHRFSRNISALGLELTKPWLALCSDALRTRLNPGEPVADWETPPMPYAVEGEEWARPL